MNNPAFGMSRDSIAKIVGPEASMLVSKVDHEEMTHGKHWRWTGEQLFTEAGLELIIERMSETHKGEALALKAEVARRLAPAVIEATPELVGTGPRKKPVHDPLNGYVPESDEL